MLQHAERTEVHFRPLDEAEYAAIGETVKVALCGGSISGQYVSPVSLTVNQ